MVAAGPVVPNATADGALPFIPGGKTEGRSCAAQDVRTLLDLAALFSEEGLFTVRVRGDALKPTAIADGDYLVLRPLAPGHTDAWRTVVAEAGNAVSLYDYVPRRGRFRLMPRIDPRLEPVVGPADGVRVLGVLVGVLRRD